jgi:hypothetical protein
MKTDRYEKLRNYNLRILRTSSALLQKNYNIYIRFVQEFYAFSNPSMFNIGFIGVQ